MLVYVEVCVRVFKIWVINLVDASVKTKRKKGGKNITLIQQ